ncbi:MAG: hypothetical protein JOZ41_08445, partial [Chloroflexi bacterium]|nr:hypothetical protein [Chloroflexota bacterium]
MDGMRDVRRVVIHDKHPILDAEVLNRPANRAVLAVAGLALLIQLAALVQVLLDKGNQVGWFDHTSFAVVSFLWLLVGLLVFMQRRGHRAGQLFLLSAAAGSVFLALGTLTGVNLIDALLFSAGVLFFPAFLLSFTRAFQEERTWRRAEALVYLPPLLLVWPMAQGFLHSQTPFLWRAGVACVGLYFCGAVLQTGRDLLVASTPERAAQTRALLFGLLAGSIPALFMYVLPLALGNQHTVSRTWQPHLVLLFLLAMSYAVLLFEFSEADLILRRGVVYGMLTLSIVIAYAVLGVILAASSSSVTNPGGGLSFVAVTVIVGAAFGPIRRTGRRLVDWLLYGRPADRWELLQELSEK